MGKNPESGSDHGHIPPWSVHGNNTKNGKIQFSMPQSHFLLKYRNYYIKIIIKIKKKIQSSWSELSSEY